MGSFSLNFLFLSFPQIRVVYKRIIDGVEPKGFGATDLPTYTKIVEGVEPNFFGATDLPTYFSANNRRYKTHHTFFFDSGPSSKSAQCDQYKVSRIKPCGHPGSRNGRKSTGRKIHKDSPETTDLQKPRVQRLDPQNKNFVFVVLNTEKLVYPRTYLPT